MNESGRRNWRRWASWSLTTSICRHRNALAGSPSPVRAFLRVLAATSWRTWAVLAGLVVQVVLTVMMWQLVDLTISLMEVWAELARKHLELVLS